MSENIENQIMPPITEAEVDEFQRFLETWDQDEPKAYEDYDPATFDPAELGHKGIEAMRMSAEGTWETLNEQAIRYFNRAYKSYEAGTDDITADFLMGYQTAMATVQQAYITLDVANHNAYHDYMGSRFLPLSRRLMALRAAGASPDELVAIIEAYQRGELDLDKVGSADAENVVTGE